MAERLLAAMRGPIDAGGHAVAVGRSIGIARRGGRSVSPGELLREADIALYRAKAAGRFTSAVHDPAA